VSERDGVRSQLRFMELARERAREQEPIRAWLQAAHAPAPPIERLRRRAEKKRKSARDE